jgi:hypothetical protein
MPIQNSNLLEKALIVKLSIGIWGARKIDKKTKDDVSSQYNANNQQLSLSKILIDKKRLQEIRELANSARQYHYDATLPWNSNGSNILLTDKYEAYDTQMKDYQQKFWNLVYPFWEAYAEIIHEDQALLGSLSDPNDYPQLEKIKKKFKFDFEYSPVPSEGDFRINLSDTQVSGIKQNFDSMMTSKLATIKSHLYTKLYYLLDHAVERLDDHQKFFKDSTINNITDFIHELPTINVVDDQVIMDFASRVNQWIPADVDSLRKDAQIRTQVCDNLKEIQLEIYQTGEVVEP